jgi:hypothetical protein
MFFVACSAQGPGPSNTCYLPTAPLLALGTAAMWDPHVPADEVGFEFGGIELIIADDAESR